MGDWIKRALARKCIQRGRVIIEEPNERLVLGEKFAIGMTAFLSALQVAHLLILGSRSSEIFSTITVLLEQLLGC